MVVVILILVTFGIASLLLVRKAWRGRTAIYRYNVREDQHHGFSNWNSKQAEIRLSEGIFRLPQLPVPGGTVLLRLRIRSTMIGRWCEPYVAIEVQGRRYRQPFERGGAGIRFIDLSQMTQAADVPIRLSGHHLEIGDQTVTVHYFQNDIDLTCSEMLVLATHPDDAEIAAFGTYADRSAHILTLTAGEAGDPGPFSRFSGAGAYREKGRNRVWNSVTVPMLGGVPIERSANLGYFDGTLDTMRRQPDAAVTSLLADAEFLDAFGYSNSSELVIARRQRRATWNNLVTDLEHVLQSTRPDIIVTPYPRLDAHPDHKMTTAALIQAINNLDWRQGSLLMYTNHLCSSDRYPFGRAGDLTSLPPGIDDIYFDGVVSVALDEIMQARKFMALDAMTDLRPVRSAHSLRHLKETLLEALRAIITDGNGDYFRQAVRANELFFQVRVSSLYQRGVAEKILGTL